jgi:hypothetical protein
LIWTHPFRQDIPTDTIVYQAEQVINPVIDTVSDRPENSEVIETERDDNQLEDQILDSEQLISNIVLPPTMKKPGRPKWITQTVIGLPKNRIRKNKCVPFDQKPSRETDLIMLEWFVGKDIATSALNDGLLIKEEHVETRPETVSSSCLDKLVTIKLMEKYCTEDGWSSIESVYSAKVRNHVYICNIFKGDADEKESSVMCSSCLEWQHLICARLKHAPKTKHWFCFICKV